MQIDVFGAFVCHRGHPVNVGLVIIVDGNGCLGIREIDVLANAFDM